MLLFLVPVIWNLDKNIKGIRFEQAFHRWQYTVKAFPDSLFEERMDDYGKHGWELVSARRATNEFKVMEYEVLLKRRLPPD